MTKRSHVAFLIDGLRNWNRTLGGGVFCEAMKHITSSFEYDKNILDGSKVFALALHNNLLSFDPIVGYSNPEIIYSFVRSFSDNKDKKAFAFELIAIRAIKDVVFAADSEYQNLMEQKDYYGLIELMKSDRAPIIQLTKSSLLQITKGYIKLKAMNHFPANYIPDVITDAENFSISMAIKNVIVKYKNLIPDYTDGADDVVNLDQYIAQNLTPEFKALSNKTGRKNLEQFVRDNPQISDIYSILGAHHFSIISEAVIPQSSGSNLNYEPINRAVKIADRIINFRIFPDQYGHGYVYNNLKYYVVQNTGLLIPKFDQARELLTDHACKFEEGKESKETYFTDDELNSLICLSVPQYSKYNATQCMNLLDEIVGNPFGSDVCIVTEAEGHNTWPWYNDIVLRGVCNIHYTITTE